ncbi:hypothetical protein ACFLVN_03650 [Chloroflexota bacterium]
MAREKQYVFSARTTEEGLRALSEVKAKLGVGWDESVIDAVCAHYGLDRLVMALPKKKKPAEELQSSEQQPPSEQIDGGRPTEEEQKKPLEEKPANKRKKGGKAK